MKRNDVVYRAIDDRRAVSPIIFSVRQWTVPRNWPICWP
jgi:hypothetical protein